MKNVEKKFRNQRVTVIYVTYVNRKRDYPNKNLRRTPAITSIHLEN